MWSCPGKETTHCTETLSLGEIHRDAVLIILNVKKELSFYQYHKDFIPTRNHVIYSRVEFG